MITIIALLVGGVLVGKDLIEAAKIRKAGTLIEQLDTAVNVFRGKYNCLPGDCLKATSLGFTVNGDGDGKIFGSANSGVENFQFFQMLIDAKLIADTRVCTLNGITCEADWHMQAMGLTVPFQTKISATAPGNGKPALGIFNTNSVTYATTNGNIPFTHVYGISDVSGKTYGSVPVDIASQLDRKFDDGFPRSGIFLITFPQDDTEFADDNRYYENGGTCIDRTGPLPYAYKTGLTGGCTPTWRASF